MTCQTPPFEAICGERPLCDPAQYPSPVEAFDEEKIAEIAAQRKRKDGTVKSDLHNVYAKASVGSRSDLLAMLMDELLHSHELSVDPRQTYRPTGEQLL